MSYDEDLATRIRAVLAERDDVVEKKMFGGLCFMVNGAMCCGLTKSDFMVRGGPDQYDDALAQPHARPMDFTGGPLKGMVYVAPEGLRTRMALASWVARGLATTPPDALDELLDGHRATVMAGGHTHIQMLRQHRGILLLNPGSVGLPFKEYVAGRAPTILRHAEYGVVEAVQGDVAPRPRGCQRQPSSWHVAGAVRVIQARRPWD